MNEHRYISLTFPGLNYNKTTKTKKLSSLNSKIKRMDIGISPLDIFLVVTQSAVGGH